MRSVPFLVTLLFAASLAVAQTLPAPAPLPPAPLPRTPAPLPATDVAKAMGDFAEAIGVHDLKVCVPVRSDPTVAVCHAVVLANAGLQPFPVICETTVAAPVATTNATAPGTTVVRCALPVGMGQTPMDPATVPAD